MTDPLMLTEAERSRGRTFAHGAGLWFTAEDVERILRDRARPADEDWLRTIPDAILNLAAKILHASYIEDEDRRDQTLRSLAQQGRDLSHHARAVLAAHPEARATEALR